MHRDAWSATTGIVRVKLKAALWNKPHMDWPELLAMLREQVDMCLMWVLGIPPPTQLLAGQPNHGLSFPTAIAVDRCAARESLICPATWFALTCSVTECQA